MKQPRRPGGFRGVMAVAAMLGATLAANPAALPAKPVDGTVQTDKRRRKKRAAVGKHDPLTPLERQKRREQAAHERRTYATRYVDAQKKRLLKGWKVDGRGDLINPERLEKKLIRKELGLNTGRKWRRFKKAAERHHRGLVRARHNQPTATT